MNSGQKQNFKYDVAFSFHSKDEQLAISLNDQVQDQFKTFIYTEREKDLAGRNGEDVFSKVFGSEARLVVIFFAANGVSHLSRASRNAPYETARTNTVTTSRFSYRLKRMPNYRNGSTVPASTKTTKNMASAERQPSSRRKLKNLAASQKSRVSPSARHGSNASFALPTNENHFGVVK
jgi:hypothetical protein